MYRIAVCEDDPRTAEQNKTAACRVLAGKDRAQGWDYDIDVSHTALDWDWQQRHIHPKHSVVWAGMHSLWTQASPSPSAAGIIPTSWPDMWSP